jgi:Protein of unknown function (DUF3892)
MSNGTYYIEAVRLEPGWGQTRHQHIGYVRLTTGIVLDRATVIMRIRMGERFFTNASPPALVYVHSCPHCGASDYITTHPDYTTTNNLLHLQKF